MIDFRSPATAQEWQAYYQVRWQVLRAPHQQPVGSERDDLEDQTHHVAAFTEQHQLVGVARLQRADAETAQIRYMAVLAEFQKKQIGAGLINYLENLASSMGFKKIKLNARDVAVPFYQKLDYIILEAGPLLYGVIPHHWMFKEIA